MIVMSEYINDTHNTVETSVAKSVIKGMCKKLDIDGKIALVKEGKEYANKYWNTGDTSKSKTGQHPLVITCIHESEYTPETLGLTRTRHNNAKPVFKDDNLNIGINVLHVGINNTLSMEIHSRSENLLDRVEHSLRLSRLTNLDIFNLNVLYRYYMTSTANALVRLGSDKPEEYIPKHTDSRFTLLSTIDGGKAEYGFKTNAMVQVTISTDVGTEKVRYDNSSGTYTYTIVLKYQYERPTFMDCHYDYMVNGKMVPDELLPAEANYRLLESLNSGNTIIGYESLIKSIYGEEGNGYYIRIPELDKHTDVPVRKPYIPIFSVLIGTDPKNPNLLFNLNQLGEFTLSDKVIALLKEEYPFLHAYSRTIFKITLYSGDVQLHDDIAYVDSELNVVLKEELPNAKTIRVLFSVLEDSSHLFKEDFKRLSKKSILGYLKDLGYLNREGDKRNLSFRLDLPKYIEDDSYIQMYSDVVIKYFKSGDVV